MTTNGSVIVAPALVPAPAPIGQVVFDGETPNLHEVRFRVRPHANTTASRMVAVEGINAARSRLCCCLPVLTTFLTTTRMRTLWARRSAR